MLVLKNTDFINIYVNFSEIHVDIAKNLLKICINHEGSDEILLLLFCLYMTHTKTPKYT